MRGKQLFPLLAVPFATAAPCPNVILILMDNPGLRTLIREGMTLTPTIPLRPRKSFSSGHQDEGARKIPFDKQINAPSQHINHGYQAPP